MISGPSPSNLHLAPPFRGSFNFEIVQWKYAAWFVIKAPATVRARSRNECFGLA
jgi:hypothetical protein